MPTKTDRILSYLPRVFQTFPRPPVLFALLDAFGGELTNAENSLATVMASHWVDLADKKAEQLHDLGRVPGVAPLDAADAELLGLAKGAFDGLASLYGLTPRDDESVEEFRDHLKRYVRTFLEGTVTVQGILRVAAEILGLRIADSYDELDTWWTRTDPELTITQTGGADAAAALFGRPLLVARGAAVSAAHVSGTVNPSAGSGTTLLIKFDALAPKQIDLGAGTTDPEKIAKKINDAVGKTVAAAIGQVLTLTSPTVGPASRLEILDVANDAAPWVWGLAPRAFHGAGAQPAQIAGNVDLSAGVSLGDARYLRLEVDGKQREIDLTGGKSAALTLDQIQTAINLVFPKLASHDGHFLSITSPTQGAASKLAILEPGSQNARIALFGTVPSAAGGLDQAAARLTGTTDLGGGADLSGAADISIRIDNGPAVKVHCAVGDPSNTKLADIVKAINLELKASIATHNNHNITLTSPTSGPSSAIVFESLPGGDAVETLFGIPPRAFSGAAATAARIEGAVDLTAGADVRAHPLLTLAIDQALPVLIDVAGSKAAPVSAADIAAAINVKLGLQAASIESGHLVLKSPTIGGASRINVGPAVTAATRDFVTRAAITGEAAEVIFGASSLSAYGSQATSAILTGTADLSNGVDLRVNRYLRLVIDSRRAVEVDCAGDRPRATLPAEVVQRINTACPGNPAGTDGKHLILTSPSSGAISRVVIEPSRSADALDILLGVDPGTYRGSAATGVSFAGMADLTAGINLDSNAAINITIDGGPAAEISLAGAAPNHKTIPEILTAINNGTKLPVARTDGQHVLITSPTTGASSKVAFNHPAGVDVTTQLFGIVAPREYHGIAAAPAKIVGKPDLSAGVDLNVRNSLRVGLDGHAAIDIDCSVQSLSDLEHAKGDDIAKSLNLALDKAASFDGKHLVIASRTAGAASSITIEPHIGNDAAQSLLGDAALTASGQDATPAIVTGPPLTSPIDLSVRDRLGLSIDGSPLIDIAVSGADPSKTSPPEIIAAINQAFPGLAELTPDSAVRLTSPTAGDSSSVAVPTLRFIDLIEYPPLPATPVTTNVPGTNLIVKNGGQAQTYADITITSFTGVSKPALVNLTTGWVVRLNGVLGAGEVLILRRDVDASVHAEIVSATGERRTLPSDAIAAGPLLSAKSVPFSGAADLTREPDGIKRLELNNPISSKAVVLSTRDDIDPDASVSVTVVESPLTDVQPRVNGNTVRLIGRFKSDPGLGPRLLGGSGRIQARLRSTKPLDIYENHVVIVSGSLYADATPVLVVDEIGVSFRVEVKASSTRPTTPEYYPFTTIGDGPESDSLVTLIDAGQKFGARSKLLKAEEYDKSAALSLLRGKNQWVYIDCEDSRFNEAIFDESDFAGGACRGQGVFDVSRFDGAVFASKAPQNPRARIDMAWNSYQPAAFTLNLPRDLAEKFGGAFNEARFSQSQSAPETYKDAVAEPQTDQNFIVNVITTRPSDLVTAYVVTALPSGRTPVALPFRKRQFLGGGDDRNPAKLYLTEEGLTGFIELTAAGPGQWGNQISVSGRSSGPAKYDIEIQFLGARFENARQTVQGPDLPASIAELLRPRPIGVLQAKAAGVRIEVTRDGVQTTTQQKEHNQTTGEMS